MPAVAVPTTPVVPFKSPFNVLIVRLVVVAFVENKLVDEERVRAKRLVVVALVPNILVEETRVVAVRVVPVAEVKEKLVEVTPVKFGEEVVWIF